MRKLTEADWRKREKKIVNSLGFRPQPLSGAGETHKEDGENDLFIMQLKGTQYESIAIKMSVLAELFSHARASRKRPVLVVDFIDFQLCCIPAVDFMLFQQLLEKHVAAVEQERTK